MKAITRPLVCLAAAMTLSACSTGPKIAEEPVSAPMEPMENIIREVGFTINFLNPETGEESSWTITDVDDDGVVTALNKDCTWRSKAEWFSPVVSWENCGGTNGWGSGKNVFTSTQGNIWPLRVGNTTLYKYINTSSRGEKVKRTRKCAVAGTARITVPMGTYDTYKVRCIETDKKRTKTRVWYFAPEIGEVKYLRYRSDKAGTQSNQDVVSVELP